MSVQFHRHYLSIQYLYHGHLKSCGVTYRTHLSHGTWLFGRTINFRRLFSETSDVFRLGTERKVSLSWFSNINWFSLDSFIKDNLLMFLSHLTFLVYLPWRQRINKVSSDIKCYASRHRYNVPRKNLHIYAADNLPKERMNNATCHSNFRHCLKRVTHNPRTVTAFLGNLVMAISHDYFERCSWYTCLPFSFSFIMYKNFCFCTFSDCLE